ncbi:MAG: type II secretion system protein GspE, partial [Xanthomonadales bacterium]|nr:type II secretion system protein GspE [Xanthomonadales bacterium]
MQATTKQELAGQDLADHAGEPGKGLQKTTADRICEVLLERERLKEADLRKAQAYREQHGGDLVALLVRLGLVSEKDVAEAEAELLKLPLVRTADFPEEVPHIEGISVRFLKQNLILPISETDDELTVVMANPTDEFAAQALRMACGKAIRPQVGIASEVENGIEKLLGGGRSAMGQIVDRLGGDADNDLEDVEHLRDLASEAPVIRL